MTETPVWTPVAGQVTQKKLSKKAIIALSFAGALLVIIVVGFIAAYVYFDAEHKVIQVPTATMQPTIHLNDRVLVKPVSTHTQLQRGWVVAFDTPSNSNSTLQYLTARIVGLPGETIEEQAGIVLINGQPLNERYLPQNSQTDDLPKQKIPADAYFVLGDNRNNAEDSRIVGSIQRVHIKWHATKDMTHPVSKSLLR